MLAKEPSKIHWSVADCFSRQPFLPVRAFIHRHYDIGMHTHEFTEINLIMSGRGEHHCGEETITVSVGDTFVLPPRLEHGYRQQENLDVFHLLINPGFLLNHRDDLYKREGFLAFFTVEPRFQGKRGFQHSLQLDSESFSQVESLAHALIAETGYARHGDTAPLTNLALYFIDVLCRHYARLKAAGTPAAPPAHTAEAIANALQLIETEQHAELTLDDLARAAHMERSHFCRVFKNATGITPMACTRERRLLRAQQMLQRTRLAVGDIGMRLGFCDASHFTRSFTARFGVTPNQFRRQPVPNCHN